MSPESLVALVAALGIGGVGGIYVRAEHERAERRRDRMIEVAEEFLAAVEVAITATRLAEDQILRFDFEEKDDARRKAASSAAIDALSGASRDLRVAEGIAARFSLIFPLNAPGFPRELEDFKERAPTHAVIQSAEGLLATLELMLSNPAVTRQHMNDAWFRFGAVHGAFTRYVNEAIWRRWLSRQMHRLRRK